MKIAVVSDTHGNISGLKQLYNDLTEKERIKKFFHLGHSFHDVDKAHLYMEEVGESDGDESTFFTDLASILLEKEDPLKKRIRKIIQVPASDDPESSVPLNSLVEYTVINGFIVVSVHDIRNLTREDLQNGFIFLHGATHIPQIEILSGRMFVNPGHFSTIEQTTPTYALIEIEDDEIRAEIRTISHKKIKSEKLKVKRARKFGAR